MYWNNDKEIREFPARVSVTMVNDMPVPTDMYEEYTEEYDDVITKIISTNNVDWENEYKCYCLSILDLLHELKKYAENELKNANTSMERERYLNRLITSRNGWVEESISVSEL